MIPETGASRQTPGWQQSLVRAITDPAELLRILALESRWLPAAEAAARQFPLRVPRAFVARMRRGDPHDPLLRQVLPLAEECRDVPGFTRDPVGDGAAALAPGVLQKYRGRVLLTATGACAVHCRYCFRRHFPYGEANPATDGWRTALDRIAADPSLCEVILSGGDPLTLSDRRLAEFTDALGGIAHVARLRIHTRLPVVLPERVDDGLVRWMRSLRMPVVAVIHANHPREIDPEVAAAIARLRAAGATVFNQAVLLRGVNDSVEALAGLSEALIACGAVPYYLHMLDRVQGAAHFEVDAARARELVTALQARLPGYLVPRLVREVEGAPSKIPECG